MIFQQTQSSLNPVYTIGNQLTEVFEIHRDMDKEERWQRRMVGIAAVSLIHMDMVATPFIAGLDIVQRILDKAMLRRNITLIFRLVLYFT